MKTEIYIDETWTLFLDRDGVINKNIDDGYVLNWEMFEFLPGVLETMPKLARMFPRIILVSNQQCIGKQLATKEKIAEIHENMLNIIELNGGRLDGIYIAPDLASETNVLRKPRPGMALAAKKDFPEIDFTKSIMVGDKISDMEFGKSLSMLTIYLSDAYNSSPDIDAHIKNFSDILSLLKC
jgi:histidinol-phosphate phosphatase family protein